MMISREHALELTADLSNAVQPAGRIDPSVDLQKLTSRFIASKISEGFFGPAPFRAGVVTINTVDVEVPEQIEKPPLQHLQGSVADDGVTGPPRDVSLDVEARALGASEDHPRRDDLPYLAHHLAVRSPHSQQHGRDAPFPHPRLSVSNPVLIEMRSNGLVLFGKDAVADGVYHVDLSRVQALVLAGEIAHRAGFYSDFWPRRRR